LLVFAVALIMLFAVHRLLSLVWKSAPAAPDEIAPPQEQPAAGIRVNIESFRLGVVALPMLATAIFLQVHSRGDVKHVGTMPYQIGDWKGTEVPIPQEELDILGPGEYLQRDYESASGLRPVNLYIPFFPSQRAGDTIHSPDHCLTGAGWIPISREMISLLLPNGTSIPVNRYVVSKSGERQLVLYWFQAHGRVVAGEWRAKYYLISDSIHMNRSDGGMVRLMTRMTDGESPDAAQAHIMKFGSQLVPLVERYIPQ
jgi:EpsI family protein